MRAQTTRKAPGMTEAIEKQPAQVFEDVLATVVSVPGIRIDREAFLREALKKDCDQETIEIAVKKNPAAANIPPQVIKRIANGSINYETGKVTLISAAAGIPGGFAMLGTLPADVTQYFAHVMRISQKLAYLYGWPSLSGRNGNMDDETKAILTLFIGIMFGAQAAGEAVMKIADMVAASLVKELPQKALTKGFIYPIVKKVATYLGIQMTKETFAKGVGKIVPVVGGVISGGITFASFRPMSAKLRNYLAKLPLADPETYREGVFKNSENISDILTVDAEVIEPASLPDTGEPVHNLADK